MENIYLIYLISTGVSFLIVSPILFLLHRYFVYIKQTHYESRNWKVAYALRKNLTKGQKIPGWPYHEGFPENYAGKRYDIIFPDGNMTQGKPDPGKGNLMWKNRYGHNSESAIAGWQLTEDEPTFW